MVTRTYVIINSILHEVNIRNGFGIQEWEKKISTDASEVIFRIRKKQVKSVWNWK